MHIMDGTASALPTEVHPAEADAPRPTAQWLAHHNAIFDLAWFQASALSGFFGSSIKATAFCAPQCRVVQNAAPPVDLSGRASNSRTNTVSFNPA